ncbi:MAG: histidine phosphatase family protein [Anaerolineae bacterium]|nr:histidine phosphatase family protein [Anaerolineae bacterium]
MQLYYVRHAQSENNLLWELTGGSDGRRVDPELTERGWQQARHLAEFLSGDDFHASWREPDVQNISGFGITHIYCGLMLRTVQTGSLVARALGLPLLGWADIHETGGMFVVDPETGEYAGQPGQTRSAFAEAFPDLVLPEEATEEGWWNRPFEAREARSPRARRVLDTLLERHGDTDDRVVMVSHGGFFNHFMGAVVGLEKRDGLWLHMNNAAITRIDFTPEYRLLMYLNRLDYMPRDLISR